MTWADLSRALEARSLLRGRDQESVAALEVSGIAHDSRRVGPGQVFVAVKGRRSDGVTFVPHALERGAVGIVSEAQRPEHVQAPWMVVDNARAALAVLAGTFYRHPSRRMQVVGITGTNGKTTTAFLVASMFDASGTPCGMLGTTGYRIADEVLPAPHTTPEATDLEALLRLMVDRGCGACAMEVSSHALALHRVDELTFAAGVFTNLTRDHLDFHGDMEAYFQAKRRLFELLPGGAPGLINVDDPRAPALVEVAERPITYGIRRRADVTPGPLSFTLEGLSFDVRTPRGTLQVRSPLVGRPNVYNILAAVSAGTALGLTFEAIEGGIAAVTGVPGRFQVVSGRHDDITVVVDYAHTDDALRNLLETARPLARGRLITVFGCGGERDRTKRPLMGAVAGRLSDVIVITSDNPRGEDPERIIEEIQRGITADTQRTPEQPVFRIADRRTAIGEAVELARPGDLVLIAGKGHEQHQVIGDQVLPFDDTVVARDALGRRHSNSGVA